MRVNGCDSNNVPVELKALHNGLVGTFMHPELVGTNVTGLTNLFASVTRASDGYRYDWSDATFKAAPVTVNQQLTEIANGLYHVPAGLAHGLAADTYTIAYAQTGDPQNVANLPRSTTLVIGTLTGTATLGDNIVDGLVAVADELRSELNAMAGVRQYKVRQLRRQWSGTYVGEGACAVTQLRTLSPDPKVKLNDTHELTEGGLQASGTTDLSEISLTYTQNQLLGEPLAANEEFFYRLDDGLGQGVSRRLYIPQDHPETDRSKTIGWQVTLRMVDLPPTVVAQP